MQSSCLQWGLFDKQFGRSDAQEPDPEGRVPLWEKASVQEMKDKFSAVGLGPRQVSSNSFYHRQHETCSLLPSDNVKKFLYLHRKL